MQTDNKAGSVFCNIIFLCFLSLTFSTNVFSKQDPRPLLPQTPIEREIKGSETQSYKITLTTNQLLFVVVEQKSVDVALTLLSPDNKKLLEVDTPNGTHGIETFSLITEIGGDYRLDVFVKDKNSPTGKYDVKIVEQRAATAQDERWKSGEKYMADALLIFNQLNPTNLPNAIEPFQKSLSDWHGVDNKIRVALTLKRLGDTYVFLSDRKKSIEFYMQSLAIWRQLKIQSEEANTLLQMAIAFNRMAQYQDALDSAHAALLLFRANKDRAGEADILNPLGNIYANLGETEQALDYYRQTLEIYRAFNNRHREAATLNNIGFAYRDAGNLQKALEYYNQSLQTFRADRPDTRGEANVLNQIGFYYLEAGDYQKALDHFNQALPIWKRIPDPFGEPAALLGLGTTYEKIGEAQKAVEHLNQSLALAREHGARSVEASSLYSLAVAARNRGNLQEARKNIEEALVIVESTRSSILSQQLRSYYFATTQRLYDFYIDLLMREGYDALALQASEKARARGLLDILSESNTDIRHGIEPSLLEKEKTLQEQLSIAEQNRLQIILRKPTPQQLQTTDAEIRRLLNEYQFVQAQIREQSPRYAALTQPQSLGIKEIQQLLDADTLLLEYSLGKEQSYLWVVSKNSIKSFRLPRREEIERAARSFYEKVRTETTAQDAEKAAQVLSKLLLEPAASELSNKRLLIVADGTLQYIPFSALPSPNAQLSENTTMNKAQRATDNYHPLILSNEIVMLPSVSTLAILRRDMKERKPAPKTIAVIADPVFDLNDPRVKAGTTTRSVSKTLQTTNAQVSLISFTRALNRNRGAGDSSLSLPRLPGTRKEALDILSLTSPSESKRALDFEANIQTVTHSDLSQYRIIHFATHGLLDSNQPELTGLALSTVNEQGKPQDGYLRLYEVYNLRLPVELIVLSACETGLGKDVRGEGLIGLTRGFMYAGAPRIVVSLWKVDDRATGELMKRFYQEMLGRHNVRPAAALRLAQISLLREKRWQSPFYWSAFTIQGEWR